MRRSAEAAPRGRLRATGAGALEVYLFGRLRIERDGRPFLLEAEGLVARAVQHEVDHLDGILFLDHLSAIKRSLLLSKWKKARKGKTGYLKEVTPQPAGEL